MKKLLLELFCKIFKLKILHLNLNEKFNYYILSTDDVDQNMFNKFCLETFIVNGRDIESIKSKLKPLPKMPKKNIQQNAISAIKENEDITISLNKSGIEIK